MAASGGQEPSSPCGVSLACPFAAASSSPRCRWRCRLRDPLLSFALDVIISSGTRRARAEAKAHPCARRHRLRRPAHRPRRARAGPHGDAVQPRQERARHVPRRRDHHRRSRHRRPRLPARPRVGRGHRHVGHDAEVGARHRRPPEGSRRAVLVPLHHLGLQARQGAHRRVLAGALAQDGERQEARRRRGLRRQQGARRARGRRAHARARHRHPRRRHRRPRRSERPLHLLAAALRPRRRGARAGHARRPHAAHRRARFVGVHHPLHRRQDRRRLQHRRARRSVAAEDPRRLPHRRRLRRHDHLRRQPVPRGREGRRLGRLSAHRRQQRRTAQLQPRLGAKSDRARPVVPRARRERARRGRLVQREPTSGATRSAPASPPSARPSSYRSGTRRKVDGGEQRERGGDGRRRCSPAVARRCIRDG